MLSNNIWKHRKRLELSQEALAQKANITYSTLIKIESGANDNPTIKTVKKLARALEITIDDLVN